MAIQEHYRIRDKAEELTKQEGKLVEGPIYFQVWSYIASIENEPKVVYARSGLKHPPHERMSPYSFVLSIRAPALICQVDEHFIDLLVVTLDGTVITRRVHCAVLICVKTGAILAGVLAMDSLNEEDYMRLIKQAIEKKDELVQRYQCKNLWPCFGKPAVIFHDRGRIFTSERAQQVIVERLKIATERAPAYCPSAKGTAEALLKWAVEKFAHRLPGTTKATPKDRGAYQSAQEAAKAGITLDVLEEYLETKRLEKQRQLDLQQGEIHTEQVQATILALRQHQNSKTSLSAPKPSSLAPAVANEDDRPLRRLAIRPRRPQHG
jgi:hypothetical protein